MAHTRSARKRARQNTTRRTRNKPKRSALRTQLRKVAAALGAKNAEAARAELNKAVKVLDTAASKGLIHRNQAARRKSRLAGKVAGLAKA